MPHRPDRRRFLALGGCTTVCCLVAPALVNLAGCGGEHQAARPVLRIPLADLPVGERQVHYLGDVPVELLRTADEVVARSLLCTHQGCDVAWEEEHQEYYCPCHDGRFAADGTVIEGPPPRPLPTFPVTLENDLVIVGP